MVTPPPRPTFPLFLVEGVKSTPCASFLQMPENTVKYTVVAGGWAMYIYIYITYMCINHCDLRTTQEKPRGFREGVACGSL